MFSCRCVPRNARDSASRIPLRTRLRSGPRSARRCQCGMIKMPVGAWWRPMGKTACAPGWYLGGRSRTAQWAGVVLHLVGRAPLSGRAWSTALGAVRASMSVHCGCQGCHVNARRAARCCLMLMFSIRNFQIILQEAIQTFERLFSTISNSREYAWRLNFLIVEDRRFSTFYRKRKSAKRPARPFRGVRGLQSSARHWARSARRCPFGCRVGARRLKPKRMRTRQGRGREYGRREQ